MLFSGTVQEPSVPTGFDNETKKDKVDVILSIFKKGVRLTRKDILEAKFFLVIYEVRLQGLKATEAAHWICTPKGVHLSVTYKLNLS